MKVCYILLKNLSYLVSLIVKPCRIISLTDLLFVISKVKFERDYLSLATTEPIVQCSVGRITKWLSCLVSLSSGHYAEMVLPFSFANQSPSIPSIQKGKECRHTQNGRR